MMKSRRGHVSRFPGTRIFRYRRGEYMVANHYLSSIAPFTSATVCPFRNAPVATATSPHRDSHWSQRHKAPPSWSPPPQVSHPKLLPNTHASVDQWTKFELFDDHGDFSPTALGLYRQQMSRSGGDNIFGDTEVGVTDKAFYSVPTYCACCIQDVMQNLLGVALYADGEDIPVMSPQTLPVMSVSTSPAYAASYLCSQDSGTGVYLERHSTPHLHRPSDAHAGGAVVLAREVLLEVHGAFIKHTFELFGVQIPPRHTLLIPPSTWHNDCFLSGTYQVGYAVATSFETIALATRLGSVRG